MHFAIDYELLFVEYMLMDMQQYFEKFGMESATQLADKTGTKVSYLKHIAWGLRKPGVKLIEQLIQASGRKLTVEGLRPDIYQLVAEEINAKQGATQETPHGTDSQNSTTGAVQCEPAPLTGAAAQAGR